MYYNEQEIGKTVELITSPAKDVDSLKIGGALLKVSERYGKNVYIVSAVTPLSVIVVHWKHISSKLVETAIPKEYFINGDWERLDKVIYLPNDGGWIQSYISRCVVRGWWKKAFEYAKEFELMWYLEKQCKFIVDGFDTLLRKNKISVEQFKTILDNECWEKDQEFTEKQLSMIESVKGKQYD